VISMRFWRDLLADPRRCSKAEHGLSAAQYLRTFSSLACGYFDLRQSRQAFLRGIVPSLSDSDIGGEAGTP
jgi:hypothetical protein